MSFSHFVKKNHRSIIVLTGLGTKKYIPVLHSRLNKISPLKSVIWCYKNQETALDNIQKKQKLDGADSDWLKWVKMCCPEYILYKESSKILGRTCDMLILQDFEALSPNMAVVCMETVKGGGVIILLLDQAKTLNEILEQQMDIHEGLGPGLAHRFNKRFFKSLNQTGCTIFLDSKCRIMNITKRFNADEGGCTSDMIPDHLVRNCSSKIDCNTIRSLCKTIDQENVLSNLIKIIDSRENSVASITAPRGRGKSAALGLAISYAIWRGIPSVLISSLFLENIQTIFELIIIGLQKLDLKRSIDFKPFYSFSGKKRMIYKIEFLKSKQFISHFHPFDELKSHPSLLVVDEAASIPLDSIKKLLSVGMVFMASTIGGYEGTGRAFKMKLVSYLQDTLRFGAKTYNSFDLAEPIRYGKNDPVEKWLNQILLLDAAPAVLHDNPSPSDCRFFYVNKSILFSNTPETEKALSSLFSVFIASHYRNSPDDLQILADAWNHEIFALLTPSNKILCAIQVAFEGKIDKNTQQKAGNLLPWVLYENFQDENFLKGFGIRIVRIAVHPNAHSMGYGTEALNRLITVFKTQSYEFEKENQENLIKIKNKVALFNTANLIKVPKMIWIGSSFGLTERLFNFWRHRGFIPMCIKQLPSRATGENSIIMLRSLHCDNILTNNCGNEECNNILKANRLFMAKFVSLLAYSFRDFEPSLSLSLVHSCKRVSALRKVLFTKDEMHRLELFSKNLLDVRSVLDIMPDVAKHFFCSASIENLSVLHQSLLLMIGCQHKSIEMILKELKLEEHQLNSLLMKVVEFLYNTFTVE